LYLVTDLLTNEKIILEQTENGVVKYDETKFRIDRPESFIKRNFGEFLVSQPQFVKKPIIEKGSGQCNDVIVGENEVVRYSDLSGPGLMCVSGLLMIDVDTNAPKLTDMVITASRAKYIDFGLRNLRELEIAGKALNIELRAFGSVAYDSLKYKIRRISD
jgi:hypothetical protein